MGGTMHRKVREPKRRYVCRKCGAVVWRASDKPRIRSYCASTGRDVWIWPVLEKGGK